MRASGWRVQARMSMSWPQRTLVAAVFLILALLAAGFLLFQAAEFIAPQYNKLVEQRLSARLGRPVRVGQVVLAWQGWHPSIRLKHVVVMQNNGVPLIRLGAVRVGIDPFTLVTGHIRPTSVTATGLSLSVERKSNGKIRISGLQSVIGGSGAGHVPAVRYLAELPRIPRIRVTRANISLRDYSQQYPVSSLELSDVQLTFSAGRDHRQLSASAQLPQHLGGRIVLEASMNGPADRPRQWTGNMHLHMYAFPVQPWVQHYLRPGVSILGGLDQLQVTGHWAAGSLQQMQARARIGPVRAVTARGRVELVPKPVMVHMSWHPDTNGWVATVPSVDLKPFSVGAVGPLTITHTKALAGQSATYTASLKRLPLADLQGMAKLFKGHMASLVAGRTLDGRLQGLEATYRPTDKDKPLAIKGALRDVALGPSGRLPGLSGLNAQFEVTPDQAQMDLSVDNGVLTAPHALGRPLPIRSLKGQLEWQDKGGGWKLAARDVSWSAAGVRGTAHASLSKTPNVHSPQVVLDSRFSAKDITRLIPYMPKALPTDLKKWVNHGLKSGVINIGRVSLRGPWDDFPFEQGDKGQLKVGMRFSNVNLHYAKGWPALQQFQGRLDLEGRSMDVKASKVRIDGISLGSGSARIPNLTHAKLHVHGHTDTDAQSLIAFIRQTPLKSKYQRVLSSIDGKGSAGVDFKLDMPLGRPGRVNVKGQVNLKGATVRYAGMPTAVKGVQGQVSFGNNGVAAHKVKGSLRGMPVYLSLKPVQVSGGQGESITASGQLSLPGNAQAFKGFVSPRLLSRFKGSTDWQVHVVVPPNQPVQSISLRSNLKGMALNLPAPFHKPADQAIPVALRIKLPASGDQPMRVHASYGSSVSSVLALKRSKGQIGLLRGELSLGQAQAQLPGGTGLVIRGHIDKLDLSAWNKALPFSSPTGGVSMLQDLNLEVGLLRVSGQAFKNQQVHAVWSASGLHIRVQGPQAQGEVVWTPKAGPDKRGMVSADFQHLHLNSPLGRNVKNKRSASYDPGKLPTFNLHCSDCSIKKLNLGTVNVMINPIAGGVDVQRLQTQSKELAVNASGQWVRQQGLSSASLAMSLHTTDLDELLRVAGFATTVNADHTNFTAHVKWLPAAKGLSDARLNGHIALHLKSGTVRGVDTGGAGKLLGLLSFDALPRRLTLDFRDLTHKGLAFDTIDGDFDVASGVARTDNLTMKAPSLKVTMHGTVDLASHTYDENVHIYPDLSSGVTLAGLLLGGPIAGAALFVVQEVFNAPLDKLTELTYHLGGTWEQPVFRLK